MTPLIDPRLPVIVAWTGGIKTNEYSRLALPLRCLADHGYARLIESAGTIGSAGRLSTLEQH